MKGSLKGGPNLEVSFEPGERLFFLPDARVWRGEMHRGRLVSGVPPVRGEFSIRPESTIFFACYHAACAISLFSSSISSAVPERIMGMLPGKFRQAARFTDGIAGVTTTGMLPPYLSSCTAGEAMSGIAG